MIAYIQGSRLAVAGHSRAAHELRKAVPDQVGKPGGLLRARRAVASFGGTEYERERMPESERIPV